MNTSTWSVLSRRRLASRDRTIVLRLFPVVPGRGRVCLVPLYLVITTKSSRSLPSSSPSTVSACPSWYRLDVSNVVPPAATKASKIFLEVSGPAPVPAVPKFAVPSAYSDTRSPVRRPKV
jgi:hypothetical protein